MNWLEIDEAIKEKSLLKHPFYTAWSNGELTLEDLKIYAKQYYILESNFPRFLSRIHSSVEDPQARIGILDNLIDEESGKDNHRELWLRFAEGLGLNRKEVKDVEANPQTRAAVDTFMELSSNPSHALGLAGLYAYESQLPEISSAKIEGLKKFYGFEDGKAIEFFKVHEELDRWHGEVEQKLIDSSGASEGEVKDAALRACAALWSFLDGVYESAGKGKTCAVAAA